MATTVSSSQTFSLNRERNAVLLLLLVLAGVAWLLLFLQPGMDDTMPMNLTMGMAAPLFIGMWAVMMVAMMFPASAPMILMFAKVHNTRAERGQAFVPTWVFVGAYILVWSAAGVVAYGAAVAGEALASESSWLSSNAGRIGGGVLIAAGFYQLSPLKRSCLTKCQTPLQFIMTSWREGYGGAFRMGLDHGLYCLGCCAFLFVILFPLGVMNVGAMIAITAFIFAEKSLPIGKHVMLAGAVALAAYGAAVVFVPDLLPTVMDSMGGMEGMGGMQEGM